MRKAKVVVVMLALALASSCSTGVDSEPTSGGKCKQVREKNFIGITYSKKEFLVDCDSVG